MGKPVRPFLFSALLNGHKKAKLVKIILWFVAFSGAPGGSVHRNTITHLYDENATRVDLDTLNKLCVFFNCKVDDLLQYFPEE